MHILEFSINASYLCFISVTYTITLFKQWMLFMMVPPLSNPCYPLWFSSAKPNFNYPKDAKVGESQTKDCKKTDERGAKVVPITKWKLVNN